MLFVLFECMINLYKQSKKDVTSLVGSAFVKEAKANNDWKK